MRRPILALILALTGLTAASLGAQTPGERSVTFHFGGSSVGAPVSGGRVELLPVLRLIGAEARFSPAAGTYGVILGEHAIQFAPGHRHVLVDGTLLQADEAAVPSPGGVAASVRFLERLLLGPLGFHLEPAPDGHRIAPGGRLAEAMSVRAAAADFNSTTTLVLTLGRAADAEVESLGDRVIVRFADAAPQVDAATPVRSRRIDAIRIADQTLQVDLARGVGLLASHELADPPRVILELGAMRVAPTPTPAPAEPSPAETPPGELTVVIDPGHGGDDHGAEGAGLLEKDLTLRIAKEVAAALATRGRAVRLTREDDESRALTDRTAFANRVDATVFVSLHANASPIASVRGAETYYMSLDRDASDAAAAAVARAENEGAQRGGGSSLDLILWDLAQASVLNQSAGLALTIQQRLNSLLDLPDRGVKQAPFVVLTGATMPAALVEVGFLTNAGEARLLGDPGYQRRLAEAIAAGIEDFLARE